MLIYVSIQYPLSIMGMGSVQSVSRDLPTARQLSALRFRANIYSESRLVNLPSRFMPIPLDREAAKYCTGSCFQSMPTLCEIPCQALSSEQLLERQLLDTH